MTYQVRSARREDVARIVRLITASNQLHGFGDGLFDEAAALRDLFGDKPILRGAVAELEGAVIGVILWCDGYESAFAARGAYIVDFFIEEALRGAGCGEALLAYTAAAVKAEGGVYLWWASALWNERARGFYKRSGASDEPVHAHALTGEAFERLAARA